MARLLLSLLAAAALASVYADDCGSHRTCRDCPAGCTFISRWDSTGWHCIDDDDVDRDNMLVMDSVDCSTCAINPDTHQPPPSCSKCNQMICGWCGVSDSSGVCMSDSDGNKAFCGDNQNSWTGSMDDCP